jgi:hypothetical protein
MLAGPEPDSAELKNAWSYTSIPQIRLHVVLFNKEQDSLHRAVLS